MVKTNEEKKKKHIVRKSRIGVKEIEEKNRGKKKEENRN